MGIYIQYIKNKKSHKMNQDEIFHVKIIIIIIIYLFYF
jgi:hypothetical protein